MKLKTKLFFFITCLILLNSCGSKKTVTEYKEKIVKDSIFITKDRFITKQVNDTITIEQPCDSLGQLKDFDRQIQSGGTKVRITSVKGDIKASVNIDSLVNERIREFKQSYQKEVEIKEVEVIRYKTPYWVWIVIILETLAIILFIKISFM